MKEGSYFDRNFTRKPVTFTPELKDGFVIDQEQFKGFSYTNSELYKVILLHLKFTWILALPPVRLEIYIYSFYSF